MDDFYTNLSKELNSKLNTIELYNHFYIWKYMRPKEDGYDLVLCKHEIDTTYCDNNKQTNMSI